MIKTVQKISRKPDRKILVGSILFGDKDVDIVMMVEIMSPLVFCPSPARMGEAQPERGMLPDGGFSTRQSNWQI